MTEKLILIEDINFKHFERLQGNSKESILKSMCIKDGIEYFCERVNIDNKKYLLKTNNQNENFELFGEENESEDPRLFLYNNEIYIIFNVKEGEGRQVCISKYDEFKPVKLFLKDGKMNKIEKNWSPLVKENKLYFVYSYHPLIIITYDFNEEGRCDIVYKKEDVQLPLEPFWKVTMRGSTNLIPYRDQYYIGLVHSTIWADRLNIGSCSYPYYFPFLVLLDTQKWKIVYLSDPLLDVNVYTENDWHCVNYPTSINCKNKEEYIVTFNINQSNALKYKLNFVEPDKQEDEIDWNERIRNQSIDTIKTFTKFKDDTYF